MRRSALLALLLLSACSWSNSLYQARLKSNDALRLERDNRRNEAMSSWGEAATKAESAWARTTDHLQRAEAKWLRGRAFAHIDQCPQALLPLTESILSVPKAPWRDALLLELAQCQEYMGASAAADTYAELLNAQDPEIREAARLHAGIAMVDRGAWADGFALLDGLDSARARFARSVAAAGLGRSAAALAEVAPFLAQSDTSVKWGRLLGLLAAHDSKATDSLLSRLEAFRPNIPERSSAWLLAAARGAFTFDPAASNQRMQRLLARPLGISVLDARVLRAERIVASSRTIAELQVAFDTVVANENALVGKMGASVRLGDLHRLSERVLRENEAAAPGSREGDMVLFTVAELSRDSLGTAQVASWLFGRIERDWPNSPYAVKAMLARIPLEPDSATSLRSRLQAHRDSPYLARMRDEATERFRQLEDSLERVSTTVLLRPVPPRTRPAGGGAMQ